MTIVAMVVVGIGEWSDTWKSQKHLFALAIVISVFAPLGDLVESMFKRNLDTKDFGSIVKGHGGVLDRFDGLPVHVAGGVLPDHGARTLDRRPPAARVGAR